MDKKLLENKFNICFIGIKKKTNNNQIIFNIRGTGLILKNGIVVTCAHVYNGIPDQDKKNIFCGISETTDNKLKTYSSYEAKFIDKNDNRDIAIIRINDNKFNTKKYGFEKKFLMKLTDIEELNEGNDIYFSGFPLANEFLKLKMGITQAISETIISNIKYNSENKIDFILIDQLVNPGSSGSPVFYKEKIIGLASGTLNRSHRIGKTLINVPVNIGLIRTSNYIIELLEKNKENLKKVGF